MATALALSLLVHVGLWAGSTRVSEERAPRAVETPDFEEIGTIQLVEVPEELRADPPPEETALRSDKSAQASTPVPVAEAASDLPQSQGPLEAITFPSDGTRSELPIGSGLQRRDGQEREAADSERSDAAGETAPLDGGEPGRVAREIGSGAPSSSLPLPSSLGLGGISFNTLEWDFAPYALALKQRIASHWYPPVAFTQGGLFGGVSVVRFRIDPDGAMPKMSLIDQAEHHSLDTAAVNAVRRSAPFPPLPDDFPEPYLEVTFSFHYLLGPRAGTPR